jgi:hypothetical protein
MILNNKICKDCKIEKDISLFIIHHTDKITGKIYYKNQCKECNKENQKEYYQENKEDILEDKKEYYQENKEEILEIQKEYYQNHKKEKKEYQKEYCQNNKENIKEYHKEYYQENKEKASENRKEYNSRPETKEKRNKREKEKRANNPILKINRNISTIIWKDIKKNGGKKNGSKSKHLNWTMDELKIYFEFLFTLSENDWMTWKNYGEWHIDHIKPLSHFKIDSMDHPDFQEAWALENLRPLEAKQNISEGNRRTEEEIKEILERINKAIKPIEDFDKRKL